MPSQSPLDTLYPHFPTIIDQMPEVFTSHQFIQALTQAHQRDYVLALAEYADTGEPFREIHRQLSARLNRHDDLANEGPTPSRDIFGNANTCIRWRKR